MLSLESKSEVNLNVLLAGNKDTFFVIGWKTDLYVTDLSKRLTDKHNR